MGTSAGNVLAVIDEALADYSVSGDAMRWAPPKAAVTFTWDAEAEKGGSAMFTGVDALALAGLRPGGVVWVDGKRYVITWVTEREEEGLERFEIELEPAH